MLPKELETPQPPHQTKFKEPTKTIKFNLSNSGELNFEGEMTEDVQELIQQLSNQAAYYKDKAAKLEEEKIKKSTETDSTVVVFVSCVMVIFIFTTYSVVSGISSLFRHQPTGNITNVQ